MGLLDAIVPPDSVLVEGRRLPRITVRPKGVEPPPAPPQLDDMPADVGLAQSPRIGLFDDIVAPASRMRTAGLPFADGDEIVGQAAAPGKPVLFHDDDPFAEPPAPRAVNGTPERPALLAVARAGELARHKTAVESALSNAVPFRLQHSRPVEIAAGLMADHGVPLHEALDRATMRLHAEEGTAEAGRISDVIGKDAFDEAQRTPASPDIAPPAPSVGWGHAATEKQARPDGEYASGDLAAQDGDAAGGKAIGSEDTAPDEERAQSRYEPASAAVEGNGRGERLTFGDGDEIVVRTSDEPYLLPNIARIGDEEYTQRATHGELDPEDEEEPPDKGPLSDDRKQSDVPTVPRPKGGVSDSAADISAIDFFNQLAAPELAQSQALTDFVQQHPKAAAAEGALGLGVVLGIPAAGAAGLLGAGAAAARTVGPGVFKSVSESMNAASAAYQARVTGLKAGTAYLVKGVKFDGFTNGVLIEAKARYAQFVKAGEFRKWFLGKGGFVRQAERQLRAANGTPIQWRFAEEAAANATRAWFKKSGISGIDIVHFP
jgi:hypothetical protein